MMIRRFIRSISTQPKHPQLFVCAVQLTDGSHVRHLTLTPERSLSVLTYDAASHPSWNPKLHNQILSAEHEGVVRFKNRFSGVFSQNSSENENKDTSGGKDANLGAYRNESVTREKKKVQAKKNKK